jgi:hypothetical protein
MEDSVREYVDYLRSHSEVTDMLELAESAMRQQNIVGKRK